MSENSRVERMEVVKQTVADNLKIKRVEANVNEPFIDLANKILNISIIEDETINADNRNYDIPTVVWIFLDNNTKNIRYVEKYVDSDGNAVFPDIVNYDIDAVPNEIPPLTFTGWHLEGDLHFKNITHDKVISATYEPTDGNTYFGIEVNAGDTFSIAITASDTSTTTVDFGVGTPVQFNSVTQQTLSNTYNIGGNYLIKISRQSGTMYFIKQSMWINAVKNVYIGNNFYTISTRQLNQLDNLSMLRYVTINNNISGGSVTESMCNITSKYFEFMFMPRISNRFCLFNFCSNMKYFSEIYLTVPVHLYMILGTSTYITSTYRYYHGSLKKIVFTSTSTSGLGLTGDLTNCEYIYYNGGASGPNYPFEINNITNLRYIKTRNNRISFTTSASYSGGLIATKIKRIIGPMSSQLATIHLSVSFMNENMNSLEFSNSITSLSGVFNQLPTIKILIFNNATPPSVSANVFNNLNSKLNIFVPDANINSYKTATNWVTYANIIFPLSECPPQFLFQ